MPRGNIVQIDRLVVLNVVALHVVHPSGRKMAVATKSGPANLRLNGLNGGNVFVPSPL